MEFNQPSESKIQCGICSVRSRFPANTKRFQPVISIKKEGSERLYFVQDVKPMSDSFAKEKAKKARYELNNLYHSSRDIYEIARDILCYLKRNDYKMITEFSRSVPKFFE